MRLFPKVRRELCEFSASKMILKLCEENREMLEHFYNLPEKYKTSQRTKKAEELEKWNNHLIETSLTYSRNKLGIYYKGEILIIKMSFSTLLHEYLHHLILLFHLPSYLNKLLDKYF